MTKVIRCGLLVGLALIIVSCACVYTVFAGDAVPDGVEIFRLVDEGLTCVVWPDGSGDCYCPCEVDCELEKTYDTPEPGEPTPTDTPPDSTPTPLPEPTSTPAVEPTDKPKCNSGGGNGSEGDPDCDPGNSGDHNNAGD